MNSRQLRDINIESFTQLSSPETIINEISVSDAVCNQICKSRHAVRHILDRQDERMLFIVGPCSIHHHEAGIEYARRLKLLRDHVADKFEIVMRAYFEKPRTTLGWKGMIYDPFLDESNDIEAGIRLARNMLLKIVEMGHSVGTEILEPIVPQYISDLVSWAAIGARTAESQPHRLMASGLSMPIGIKNATDGSLNVAVDAIKTAEASHAFIGINSEGRTAVCQTRGNHYGHIVLRGGRNGPNYTSEYIDFAKAVLAKSKLPLNIIIDCSHANSGKDPAKQPYVLNDVIDQRIKGEKNIRGVMIESNLIEGRQEIPEKLSQLIPGLSITDGCLGWENTEKAILDAYKKFKI